MAMDLLKQIASSPLPMYFRSSEDIDKVRLLRAAGLVIAFVPADADPTIARPAERAAEVFAVTQKGRKTLQEIGYPDEQLLNNASAANLAQRLRTVVERARQTAVFPLGPVSRWPRSWRRITADSRADKTFSTSYR